jgi:Tol biopolymer transport system component
MAYTKKLRQVLTLLIIAASPILPAFHRRAASQQLETANGPQSVEVIKQNGKLVFTHTRDGNVEIYVMNADGGGQVRLTNNPAFDGDPVWSPDGTRIVFTSSRDGNEEIYSMNADGSSQTRLTNNVALDRTPTWSPDGSQIAFASNRDSTNFDIFVMNADGTSPTNISDGVNNDFQDPDWSPDGTRIACSQASVVNGVRGLYGVLVMGADGTNQTRLTAAGNVDITPRWSPDGSKLAFASDRVGNFGTFEVFSMNANGTNQTRLTNNLNENSRPAWSPDGTKIVFQSNQRFSFDVYTINAGGGGEVQLTSSVFDEAQPFWQTVTPVPFNPIDDSQVFVRRHYLDFLNREPDSGGFGYWVSQITQCGNDQACINRKRIDVSAAFFIEQEFQQTGFFVERFYEAALCRLPTFAEFTSDRSGLIVGANLEANKQTFAQQFVGRNEFIQEYPTFLTAGPFVEELLGNILSCSGVDLSSQRPALIGEHNSSTDQTISRARVMRAVVDNANYIQAEFNRGFVLAEYFGYLRRDPDPEGFAFWLNVLNNQVPGNFRSMVCAFITSEEYQERFGPTVTHSNSECAD